MSDANPYVELTISPDTGLGFILDTMEATEELGRPFTIALDVSSERPEGDLHALLGRSATVSLSPPGKAVRHFNGIVARVGYRGLTGGGHRYRLELRPWIWLLSHGQDCRIFSGKSPWQIITEVFRDAGFTDFADKRQKGAGGTVLDYCVQYRESSLDFVTRLMERHGLHYFVTHARGTHTINITDDAAGHPTAGGIPYRYRQEGMWKADDHVWEWTTDARIVPGATVLRDYNFLTPKADLTAKSLTPGGHTHGDAEVYDFPGGYPDAAEGRGFADIRMEEIEARRQVHAGTSNSRALGAGTRFTLQDFPAAAANREYLIVASTCTVDREETRALRAGEDMVDTFRCVLHAVPAATPFRLAPLTPRPAIRGPQTARVTGPAGQEINTDKHGRVKVKFPWDRRAAEDENSSCWIRVAQLWAGRGWGAMFVPRVGQEVVVEFLEGDPDRPLVTGRVYNAEMTVPYELPANGTRSTIKSNSSPKGTGFNELRFEDKKDAEEVFLHAQKDLNRTVLNDRTATVGNDETLTVQKGNRAVTVSKGNDTHTVTEGNREATVGKGNDTLTVDKGNHGITVSAGSSTIEAKQKITLKVGESSIELTPTGITIKAPTVKVEGATSATVTSPATKVEGTMTLELTGAAQAKLVGGVVMIN